MTQPSPLQNAMPGPGGQQHAILHRLQQAGLPAHISTQYMSTLRAFLNARMTKAEFDTEITALLPPDKRRLHNAIITSLLRDALSGRPGSNLPALPHLPRRRSHVAPRRRLLAAGTSPARRAAATSTAAAAAAFINSPCASANASASASVGASAARVRKRGIAVVAKTPSNAVAQPAYKRQRRVLTESEEYNHGFTAGTPIGEPTPATPKTAARRRRRAQQRPQTATATGMASATTPPPPTTTPGVATETARTRADYYNSVTCAPCAPSLAMDMTLFRRLKTRVQYLSREVFGMPTLQDDAVGLLLCAVESRVKSLFAVAVRARPPRGRDAPFTMVPRPLSWMQGFRHAVGNGVALFGDESGVELERLLLLQD